MSAGESGEGESQARAGADAGRAACAEHPAVPASARCSGCNTPRCDGCLSFAIDGAPACAGCGVAEAERSEQLGSAVLGLVGVGYLGTLAVGISVFNARPFVGGLAAVVAIATARVLQMFLRSPLVTRRSPSAPSAPLTPPRGIGSDEAS